MFVDLSHLSAQSDQRRAQLLADAEAFRLARLVRRAGRRRRAPSNDPPQPEPEVRAERTPAPRDDDADRRCAVPR